MNKNALAVLLGLVIAAFGTLNGTNNFFRVLTSVLLVVIGLFILVFGVATDRIE